jgi:glycosyltransferase involved in cell wall biosynthesis
MKQSPTFTVAVPTHNPDKRNLGRLLAAIGQLNGVAEIESVLLVDNNSKPRLDGDKEVVDFLCALPNARYLYESVPGLTAARCRAIRESNANVVVFFDDDNEPASNYLMVLEGYFRRYPNVGIWGPGTVNVEYLDETPEEIRQRPELFQQAKRAFGYACIAGYFGEVTPLGTGFAVRREVLQQYERLVSDGTLCLTDRQGKSLSSGGDVQIIWEAAKMGLASGVIPELVCGHLINADKANIDYLGRLEYGCAGSYAPAISQSFPDLVRKIIHPPDYWPVFKVIMKQQLTKKIKPHRRLEATLIQARLLGQAVSQATVCNNPTADRFLKLAQWLGFC